MRKTITSEKFLDIGLYKELRKIVNSSEIFSKESGHKERFDLICVVMDRLETSINYLNNHSNYPEDDEKLITFMVFACMMTDGVKKLAENIFHKKYDTDEKKYFLHTQQGKGLNINKEDFLSDDKMFEYFRALIFAHPYNTDRYLKIILEHRFPLLLLPIVNLHF